MDISTFVGESYGSFTHMTQGCRSGRGTIIWSGLIKSTAAKLKHDTKLSENCVIISSDVL